MNAAVQTQAGLGALDAGTAAMLLATGQVPAEALAFCVQWTGAALTTALGVAKSTLASAFLIELAVAKAIDFELTRRLRQPGSKAERFYAAMARAGLEAGWRGDHRRLPWWYGALSYGATGSIDYLLAQSLGDQLRQKHDELLAKVGVEVSAAQGAERSGREPWLLGPALEHLATLLPDPERGFESPLTRHLVQAIRGDHDPELVKTIEARLSTEHPGDALLGTAAGHGAAGALVGTMLGDPLLGLVVGVLDSLGDGVLSKNAVHGRIELLVKVKSQLLLQGWEEKWRPDWATRLTDFYAPIGIEFRQLGRDLRLQLDRADQAGGRLSEAGAETLTEGWPEPLRALNHELRSKVDHLISASMSRVESELEEHAARPLPSVLREDFPEAVFRAERSLQEGRKKLFAAYFVAAEPVQSNDRVSRREAFEEEVVVVSLPPEHPDPLIRELLADLRGKAR